MGPAFAWAMAEAESAQQAATATREDTSQQRAGRTRRISADPQRAQQGATAVAAAAPAALDSLSRLQQLADASPRVAQLRRLRVLADGRFAPVAQLAGSPEEEELVQGKFASAELQPQLQQAPRANNTGLPDQLKSGIESLSGLSMDHVRVHFNSSQPAQLNALAYAQGNDIHLAPGQEQHLPHEAWHVVQQAQGRVRPTMQMKEGVQVNDDVGLEREADVMGARALEPGQHTDETHRSIFTPIETAHKTDGGTTNSPDVSVASNHSAALTNVRGSAQRGENEMQRIADHRPEAALRRQVQAWGDGSERVGQSRAWQVVADGRGVGGKRQDLTLSFDGNPLLAAQRRQGGWTNSRAAQLQEHRMADGVVQPKFKVGGAAEILMKINTSQAPAIYRFLLKGLNESDKEVAVDLVSGGECASYNFVTATVSLNGKSISDALAMARKNEKGWEGQLNFMYATICHELRHAYDHTVDGIEMLSREMTEINEIWGLYKTELNAWHSEARAYLERGDRENDLVQGWVKLDPTTQQDDNKIWGRIIHYTDGPFQACFPAEWRGNTWQDRMQRRFMKNEDINNHLARLRDRFIERYYK